MADIEFSASDSSAVWFAGPLGVVRQNLETQVICNKKDYLILMVALTI